MTNNINVLGKRNLVAAIEAFNKKEGWKLKWDRVRSCKAWVSWPYVTDKYAINLVQSYNTIVGFTISSMRHIAFEPVFFALDSYSPTTIQHLWKAFADFHDVNTRVNLYQTSAYAVERKDGSHGRLTKRDYKRVADADYIGLLAPWETELVAFIGDFLPAPDSLPF